MRRTSSIGSGVLLAVCLLASSGAARAQRAAVAGEWPQWGGPDRNFIVETSGLAESWPAGGPPVLWSRPLGTGHSAIVASGGRLFTMYRAGNGRAKQGPWEAEEAVIALDAATGRTLWEYKYPSRREDFGFGAGPHSTPLVVGDRLFAFGTNKQLHALDTRTGKVLWSHDLVRDFNAPTLLIRPVVKAGYGCSPIAFRDTIICSVGGPGQSVMAFRQSDGAVVWKNGDFLTSEAPPILIDAHGTPQLVVFGGGTVNGLDPATGRVLWSHPHDPGNDLNCGTPIWGPGNVLFLSSAYKAGSRAILLRKDGNAISPEEQWFSSRVRFMFLNAVRLGKYVYGTMGDFGPAFLTALDLDTGEARWQHRGFGRASLVYGDGKAIILDEDGDLALATLTPEGITVLAQAKVFETTSWTVPTLAGTTLFARDREKIVALDLGRGPTGSRPPARGSRAESPVRPGPRPATLPGTQPSPRSLAGTWKLDADRSKVDASAALAGLAASGAPATLHITHPANGTVVVESQINESHARMYAPGRLVTTPVTVGPAGSVATKARWEGDTLVADGWRATPAGMTDVREAYELSADGRTLTLHLASGPRGSPGEKATSTAVYTRTQDVGPCQSWPTPCKVSS